MTPTKGIPWSTQEHEAFLQGLQKCGKGNWKAIATFFVPSRTCTQVASHAQKYFQKLEAQQGIQKQQNTYVKGGRGRPPKSLSAANAQNNNDNKHVTDGSKSGLGVSSTKKLVNSADINNHIDTHDEVSGNSNTEHDWVHPAGEWINNSISGTLPDVDHVTPRVLTNTRYIMDSVPVSPEEVPVKTVQAQHDVATQVIQGHERSPDPPNHVEQHVGAGLVRYVYEEHVRPDGSVQLVQRQVVTTAASPMSAPAIHDHARVEVVHQVLPQYATPNGTAYMIDVPPPQEVHVLQQGFRAVHPAERAEAVAIAQQQKPVLPLVSPRVIQQQHDRQYITTEHGTFFVTRVQGHLDPSVPHILVSSPSVVDGGVPGATPRHFQQTQGFNNSAHQTSFVQGPVPSGDFKRTVVVYKEPQQLNPTPTLGLNNQQIHELQYARPVNELVATGGRLYAAVPTLR